LFIEQPEALSKKPPSRKTAVRPEVVRSILGDNPLLKIEIPMELPWICPKRSPRRLVAKRPPSGLDPKFPAPLELVASLDPASAELPNKKRNRFSAEPPLKKKKKN